MQTTNNKAIGAGAGVVGSAAIAWAVNHWAGFGFTGNQMLMFNALIAIVAAPGLAWWANYTKP